MGHGLIDRVGDPQAAVAEGDGVGHRADRDLAADPIRPGVDDRNRVPVDRRRGAGAVGPDVEHRRRRADDGGCGQHRGERTAIAHDGPHRPDYGERLLGRRRLERGIVGKNRLLETLQRLAGLDPELLDEQPPRVAIHLERLGLTTRAIQREHQLST